MRIMKPRRRADLVMSYTGAPMRCRLGSSGQSAHLDDRPDALSAQAASYAGAARGECEHRPLLCNLAWAEEQGPPTVPASFDLHHWLERSRRAFVRSR
jgi:hypothetical protein